MKRSWLFTIQIILMAWLSHSIALAEVDARVARIAKTLKPISDVQWSEIIKNKADAYDIQKGDTLWDISKRLFGDAYYWPKIWSLNTGITNPHVVTPGEKIMFASGSSESLPHLGTEGIPSVRPQVIHEYDKVSQDLWKPIDVSARMAKDYDEYGFDRDLRVRIPTRFTFRVPGFVNATTVPFLGEVIASRRDAVYLSQYEIVFLKSDDQALQVGSSYSILSKPASIHEKLSDRTGELYRTIGEVKIIGIKDELYVGKVDFDYRTMKRGDHVYPLLPTINDMKPIAAKEAFDAVAVAVTNHDGATLSSQYDFIYLDRGVEDGVEVGNVFRFYEYRDPLTGDKLTNHNMMLKADAIVVHSTSGFSTALIIHSYDLIKAGDLGVLLTDVSDIEKRSILPTLPEDDLDNLNDHEGLSEKERRIIEQLENWDKTHQGEEVKEQPVTPAEPAPTEPTPNGKEELPPPGQEVEPTAVPANEVPPSEKVEPALPKENLSTPPPSTEPEKPVPSEQLAPPEPSAPMEEPITPGP